VTDEQDLARQERLLRYQRDQTLARIHMLQQQINAQQRVNQWWPGTCP